MSPKTIAKAIVAQLASWEVEYVFGVCGSDVLPFLDAMKANGKIKYIAAAHEAGAAYMATYYAKLTGGLGVCLASAAGAVNLLEGVADAHLNGLPVLALTGQVARSKIGTPVKQYFRQNALYDCFTGYTETVADEASALKLLIRAMSRALLGRKAAHLALPEDIWLKTTQWETASKPALLGQQMRGRYLKGDVEKAKGLMLASKYPLVVIGEKGKQVRDEIISLAERWGAAVVLTQECKGLIPDKWHRVIG
ncbi:MAG TPA: thiamine pyrophosphate-binding protein, partial [Clostridia bacterium]|nr:thiamine pyrophosphate-binding protein [Clostridia bacterium]